MIKESVIEVDYLNIILEIKGLTQNSWFIQNKRTQNFCIRERFCNATVKRALKEDGYGHYHSCKANVKNTFVSDPPTR